MGELYQLWKGLGSATVADITAANALSKYIIDDNIAFGSIAIFKYLELCAQVQRGYKS